jgi:hypothetical protein
VPQSVSAAHRGAPYLGIHGDGSAIPIPIPIPVVVLVRVVVLLFFLNHLLVLRNLNLPARAIPRQVRYSTRR